MAGSYWQRYQLSYVLLLYLLYAAVPILPAIGQEHIRMVMVAWGKKEGSALESGILIMRFQPHRSTPTGR